MRGRNWGALLCKCLICLFPALTPLYTYLISASFSVIFRSNSLRVASRRGAARDSVSLISVLQFGQVIVWSLMLTLSDVCCTF